MRNKFSEGGLRFYNEAAPLVEQSEGHALKGSFHIEFGLVFRRLAAPENREDYLGDPVQSSSAQFRSLPLAVSTLINSQWLSWNKMDKAISKQFYATQ
jgi:hypothetical protein